VDIREDLLVETQKELESKMVGAECMRVTTDVTNPSQVSQAVRSVLQRLGKIDVFVGAAGITGKTNVLTHQVEIDDFNRVLDVNVKGIFYFCREIIPSMLERNYGRIVNIASISGKEGNAGMLAYSTSKAGVIGLTKVIGKEYAETGITCNAISPAVIHTDMVDALPSETVKYMTDKIPMKRMGEPEEVAALVAFVASKEASFTSGFTFDLSGGRATY